MDYELIRSERRTLAIQVKPDGRVVVRAPKRMAKGDIDAAVGRHAAWIQRKQHAALTAAPATADRLTEAELRALAAEAATDLETRVRRFAPLVGVSWTGISVRRQRSRWGSCSARGSLNFNCLLMLCPPEIRDYVAVHELCHRLHMNHSAAFWAEVERILPDWKARRRWLRTNGPAVLRRLTG